MHAGREREIERRKETYLVGGAGALCAFALVSECVATLAALLQQKKRKKRSSQ